MEFWGIELKGDKPVKVVPAESQVVHLSQATLVDIKKGSSDSVTIFANIGGQKLAIGILNGDKFPQVTFDLVFEKEFELSHNSKNGNVHLTGYKSQMEEDEDDMSDYDEEEMAASLGLPMPNANGVAAAAPAAAPKPKAVKDSKPALLDTSDDSEDEDESDDSDSDSDKVMAEGDSDDSEDEDESEEEKEETPVKSAGGKKRANPAAKTPEAKKAKLVTPLKSDGKKSVGGHVATPHPSKKDKSPKSAGSGPACGPCKKTFNSQGALDSHTKAKHSAAK